MSGILTNEQLKSFGEVEIELINENIELKHRLSVRDFEFDIANERAEKAEAKLKLAEDFVNDWLSEAHGNTEWVGRFYYALSLELPEWLGEWTDEYVEKHQYYFKRWLDEEKEKLGIKDVKE